MVTVIFAIASLIILTPIILFLPIGFSRKGRIGIIVIAFILANIGLLASMLLPLYQTLLIIGLLSGLTSILLEKRMQKSQVKLEITVLEKEPLQYKNIHSKEDIALLIEQKINYSVHKKTADSANHTESDNLLELEVTVPEKPEAKHDIKIAKPIKKESVDKVNQLDIDEDISFLASRAESFNFNESAYAFVEEKENDSDNVYMSEIEKLIEENYIESNDVYIEIVDSIPQGEIEELEEIELQNVANNFSKKVTENIINDEIEIEELVFNK